MSLYSREIFETVIGGSSAIEIPRLSIKSIEEAYAFVKSYGYDLNTDTDLKKLWDIHRRALVLLRDQILLDGESIPTEIEDARKLGDIRNLLLMASDFSPENQQLQKWACAVLRVMHVFVHSENDLFSFFAPQIQSQILSEFEACVVHEGGKIFLKHPFSSEEIPLKRFETKPFKTTASSAIKLLAKPGIVSLTLLDKIGVRMVTESLVDSFKVVRFLIERNLINFAHIMPDQSSNNLYPLNLLFEAFDAMTEEQKRMSSAEIDIFLREYYNKNLNRAEFARKENVFSSQEYRFIKFICRKLIKVARPGGSQGETISFFYPFEVQVVDDESHVQNESGESSHRLYKDRQKTGARRRALGIGDKKGEGFGE